VSRVRIAFGGRGEVTVYTLALGDDEARRGWQAMMLAPTLEVCRALLRGESVPLDLLDAEWVGRFGRAVER
jgi:hypothetical protein